MPKVKEGIKYNKKYDEEDIAKALQAIEDGMSQRHASLRYNVPRATLQFRQGVNFRNKITPGPRPVLTDEEEQTLEDWIFSCHTKGFPVRSEDVQISVKKFLDNYPRPNPFTENLPSRGWMRAFLRRHPNVSLRTSEAITAASANISESDIRKWFIEIESYLKEKHLFDILEDPNRVFNGDETCFLLCPKNKKVLAPKGAKNVYEVEHHPKKNLTVMFTFGASGLLTPPMIIYAQSRLTSAIINSVPGEWGIGLSDNGWMKHESFYEYIGNVLHPFLRRNGTKFPIILFVDGHSTHLTYQVSQLCTKLEIILIALYPNATRILQPADVAAFKPLKNGWKAGVLEFRQKNPEQFPTKDNFALILKNVIDKTFKTETIKNGFRATGLFPWNSSAIDFKKCVGHKTSNTNTSEKIIKGLITLEEFRGIIGEQKYQLLASMNADHTVNEDLALLKNLFDAMHDTQNAQHLANQNLETESLNNNKDDKAHHIQEAADLDNKQDQSQDTQHLHDQNITATDDYKHDLYFDIENMPVIIDNFTSEDMPLSNFLTITPEKCESSKSIYVIPSTSTSEYMNSILTWPKTPERKGKKQTARLPFVLTSTTRKKAEAEKEEKKKREESLKQKRKTEKIQKQQEKQQKLQNKIQDKQKIKSKKIPTKKKQSAKVERQQS